MKLLFWFFHRQTSFDNFLSKTAQVTLSCLDILVYSGIMGRKAGALYINPKKFGSLSKPCMKEMITFLNCLSLNHVNDEKCAQQKELLSACMDAQTGKSKKPLGSINYHLQRLSRGRK